MSSKKNQSIRPEMIYKLCGHNEAINSLSFSTNQQQLISCSSDHKLYLWDLKQKVKKANKLEGHKSPITEVAFSPSGSYMASASQDNTVRIWNNSKVDHYPSYAVRSHTACVRTVAFSPDSRFFVSGSDDKSVKQFLSHNRKFVKSYVGHKNWLKSVRVSHDSETIASGGYDKALKIWDLETGKLKQEFHDHKGVINAVRYLPDNNCLASCSEDKTIRIYDLRVSTLLQFYTGHHGAVNDISFHNSGHYMVSVSKDSYAKLWDLRNGRPMYKIEAHQDSVNCCQFAYRGDTFLTGGSDKGILGWEFDFSSGFGMAGDDEAMKSLNEVQVHDISQSNIHKDYSENKKTKIPSSIPKSRNVKSQIPKETEKALGALNSISNVNSSYKNQLMETKDLLMSYSGNQENVQSYKYDTNLEDRSTYDLNKNNAVSQIYPNNEYEKPVQARPNQPIIKLDPQINNNLDKIKDQLEAIFDNLKMMEGRISDNEHDVMKLCKFLRQDITLSQENLVATQLSTDIQSVAAQRHHMLNQNTVEKKLVTKEYLDTIDYRNANTLNRDN